MRRGERSPRMVVVEDNIVILCTHKHTRIELLHEYSGTIVLRSDAKLGMIHNPADNTFSEPAEPVTPPENKRTLIDVLERDVHLLIRVLSDDELISGPAKKRLQAKLREYIND